jgi:hypothetical protein
MLRRSDAGKADFSALVSQIGNRFVGVGPEVGATDKRRCAGR